MPKIEITPRDLKILRLVYDYRWVSTRQVKAIFGSSRHLDWRLQWLYHRGFLDRPRKSEYNYLRGRYSYRSLPLAVTDEAAQLLAEQGLVKTKRRRFYFNQNNRDTKAQYIWHQLRVSESCFCLLLALGNREDARLVASLSGEKVRHQVAWEYSQQGLWRETYRAEDQLIRPDRFLILESNHRDPDRPQAYYFLEYETMSRRPSVFQNKVRAYEEYHRIFIREREQAGPFGMDNMRVLVVTPTETDSDKLREYTAKAGIELPRLFYFTSEKRYTLDQPDGILWCWTNALGEEDQSLLY
ncbi:MAG: replication-relaxation family protein [Candidatus Binatia bacterium]